MIKVEDLKEGDTLYWNKGTEFFKGTYVKKLADILDLKAILIKLPNGSVDEILDVFLISEQQYEAKTTNVKKGVRTKMEKKMKDVVLKPNMKGISILLQKEGAKIERLDKWFRFVITTSDATIRFEKKVPVKELYALVEAGGLQNLLQNNEVQ